MAGNCEDSLAEKAKKPGAEKHLKNCTINQQGTPAREALSILSRCADILQPGEARFRKEEVRKMEHKRRYLRSTLSSQRGKKIKFIKGMVEF